MSSSRTYKGIEIFRVVAAFLVVAIHTSPLAGYSGTADFVFTRVIARVAVPFFFMVTGYFVLSKGTGVRRFLKKTAIIYAASAALYLPINVYAGHSRAGDCSTSCSRCSLRARSTTSGTSLRRCWARG